VGLALGSSHNLHSLDLGCNRIRNKGAESIFKALFQKDRELKLQVLGLKNNFFNDKAFHSLADLLERSLSRENNNSFSLLSMLVSGNEISLCELKAILKTTQKHEIPFYLDAFDRLKMNLDNVLFLSNIDK